MAAIKREVVTEDELEGVFDDGWSMDGWSDDNAGSSFDEGASDVSSESDMSEHGGSWSDEAKSLMSLEESSSSDSESGDLDVSPPLKKRLKKEPQDERPSPTQPPAAAQVPPPARGRPPGRRRRPPAVQPAPATQAQAQWAAPDGTIWTDEPAPARKTAAHNILTEEKGPRNLGGESTQLGLFELFFPDAMLQIILAHTNAEGLARRGQQWINVAMIELRSTIGLLLFLGLTKSGHERVRSFWRAGLFSRPTCQATMSGRRFQEILNMLRFDDITTHAQRKADDKFASIREVFDMFAASLRRYFSCGECVTIDEQLVAFRGRCSFRQYMPSKPAKYGLKFWACVDSETHYVYNMQPYMGKQDGRRERVLGARVVKDLVESLYGTGRNVTADNFFVSKNLGDHLLSKRMTLVGSMKDHRREVPYNMRIDNVNGRKIKSSKFLFSGETTLVSFIPKKNRNVLLMSNMHHNAVTDDKTQKPDIITYYNATKAGVDTVDQMCSLYNCARITRRWPMVVFFHMLNCAVINAHVLFRHLHPNLRHEEKTRHDFLKGLTSALIKPQIKMRLEHPERLREGVLMACKHIGYQVPLPAAPQSQQRRPNSKPPQRRCAMCPRGKKRQTKRVCSGCKRFSCQLHSKSKKTMVISCTECLLLD